MRSRAPADRSRLPMTGVATLYGRFATNFSRQGRVSDAPSERRLTSSRAASTCGFSSFLFLRASAWRRETFASGAFTSRAKVKKPGSISTPSTARACSARRTVRPPVPLPISSTTSSLGSSAARRIKSSKLRSMRKFCPNLFLGLMPRSSNRLRRYESVCRGEFSGTVMSTHEARLPQRVQGYATTTEALPDVLGQQVCLQINGCPSLFEAQGGAGERVRNQGHPEAIGSHVHHGQADAVHGYRSLGNHLRRQFRGAAEPKQPPVALPQPFGNMAQAVHMPLDEV